MAQTVSSDRPNDNLSGIAVAVALAMRQAQRQRRLGFRVLFIPATIGAITWLAHNETHLDRIRHGLVLTCIGDGGRFHYKTEPERCIHRRCRGACSAPLRSSVRNHGIQSIWL